MASNHANVAKPVIGSSYRLPGSTDGRAKASGHPRGWVTAQTRYLGDGTELKQRSEGTCVTTWKPD